MAVRPVALIVHQQGNCPLLKDGDRFVLSDSEVLRSATAKICAPAICSVYPKLRDLLASLPLGASLPDDYLLCDAEGCDAAFRMEFTKPVDLDQLPQQTSTTRRYERGAATATMVLKKNEPFLKRLPMELADELVRVCQRKRYEHCETILPQGVVGEHLYIVQDGSVEVVRRRDDGETVLVTLGVGECFGEMGILTGEPTSAEVRSFEKTTILLLGQKDLDVLLARRPALSHTFSKLLAERLKAQNVSFENETSKAVAGKLSMIPIPDLVQTLTQGKRTGTLVLTNAGATAQIGFRNGVLVSATLGEHQGEEAFYQTLSWPDGEFHFEPTEPPKEGPSLVKLDMMGLMMEGMRRMDELKAAKAG